MATKLLYLDDFDVISAVAAVLSVFKTEDGRDDVVLDQTCFYPRGGGQDWDEGVIQGPNGKLLVREVRLDEEGTVHHIGTIEGKIDENEAITCQVDKQRRNVNTRLHSAGHVIDMAVNSLGLDWVPGKGAHYPHMSFVEYDAMNEDEAVTEKIQQKVNETLQENIVNTLRYVDKEELAKLCRHVPTNIPSNKPTRVVLYGDFGVPCGGTHVKQLKDIGTIEVTKVKSKKGITKVSYHVKGIEGIN
jgi:Ser-tRNA(Ala) deacylase AlaX